MRQEDFMIMVVEECQKRSFMTYRFSKRKLKKFKNWFFRKGRKHFGWTKWKAQREWVAFIKAYNITTDD